MGTVVIGCKVQNGIIIGDGVVIRGPTRALMSHRTGTGAPGADVVQTVGGYAFTEVDEDIWNSWFSSHQDSDMVKRGLVFTATSMALAKQRARTGR